MKKRPRAKKQDELRPEYDIRALLKKAVRGKYARQYEAGTNVVILDPDVARAFSTSESVNQALRLALELSRVAGRHKRRKSKV
jgi:hypothetical protein